LRPAQALKTAINGKMIEIVAAKQPVCVLVLLFVMLNTSALCGPGPFDVVDVYLTCSCPEAVGANLCYTLKKRIRSSPEFHLVESERTTAGIAAHLVCIEGNGSETRRTAPLWIVAVALTTFVGDLESYETLQVMKASSHQADAVATSILSMIQEVASKRFEGPSSINGGESN
jgi:hypothetical protein